MPRLSKEHFQAYGGRTYGWQLGMSTLLHKLNIKKPYIFNIKEPIGKYERKKKLRNDVKRWNRRGSQLRVDKRTRTTETQTHTNMSDFDRNRFRPRRNNRSRCEVVLQNASGRMIEKTRNAEEMFGAFKYPLLVEAVISSDILFLKS